MPHHEKSHAIAIHLRETFRYVAEASGLEVGEDGSFVTITSGSTVVGANFILGVGEPSTSQEYDFLLKPFFIPKPLSFVWFSELYTPHLARCLTDQGLSWVGPLTGLWKDVGKKEDFFATRPDLAIIPVTTPSLFQKWCAIHAATWNKSQELTELFFRGLSPSPTTQKRCHLFLAQFEGAYVGSSLLYIQGDQGGCYWDCVLPDYRKRGIGSAMIAHRLGVAAQKGCTSVVAQCVGASCPLYLKAGFQKHSEMALFRYVV